MPEKRGKIPTSYQKDKLVNYKPAIIAFGLVFALTLIWTPFLPNISLSAENLFNFVGENGILEQILSINMVMFLLLAPLSYAAISALSINKADLGWVFSTIGMLLAILIGGIIFRWDTVYLLTGLIAAGLAPMVFNEASVKFAELKGMNALRASWISTSNAITLVSLGMFIIIFLSILPVQATYFDTAVQNSINGLLPTAQGLTNAQNGILGLCGQYKTQIISELSKPTSRVTIEDTAAGNPEYENLDDTHKKQFIDQQMAATETQKKAIITQLENTASMDTSKLPSKEEQYNQVYGALINASPLISELKNYFAILLALTIVGTVLMIAKFTIAPLAGVYGAIFKRLFEILFK